MSCRLYEQKRFREAAGGEFRPGGIGLTQELAAACALAPGQRVLDLGCGVGSTASFLAARYGVDAVGLDGSAAFIDEARERDHAVEWVLGRADALPFPDGSFTVVFCECFLSLFDDPGHVLREMRRVLGRGGRLALSDMYLRDPAVGRHSPELPAGSCLRAAVSLDEMRTLIENAGFEVTLCEDRSESLKTLMAALIFSYGSAAGFWEAATGGGETNAAWLRAVRPGYLILAARAR